jgi:hypothetical protein
MNVKGSKYMLGLLAKVVIGVVAVGAVGAAGAAAYVVYKKITKESIKEEINSKIVNEYFKTQYKTRDYNTFRLDSLDEWDDESDEYLSMNLSTESDDESDEYLSMNLSTPRDDESAETFFQNIVKAKIKEKLETKNTVSVDLLDELDNFVVNIDITGDEISDDIHVGEVIMLKDAC